eukprot:NODE_316_length_9983_cov_1.089741.p3 type:complete len:327 gc:universal NODE_316_length_9983_cov_1.089741:3348-2368(-)
MSNNLCAEVVNRTNNPIRAIVDNIQEWNDNLEKIPLSIGDPTIYGNFPVPESVNSAMIEAIRSGKANGYPPSVGYLRSREAVANFWSKTNNSKVEATQVILASGCSHALEMSIKALCNPGDAILIAKPSFSLYTTLAHSLNLQPVYYDLLPDKQWELDLAQLETILKTHKNIKTILINNPSNPCGSNYSLHHLKDVIKVIEHFSIPIIADEIYANMNFEGSFHCIGELTSLPVLSTGGIAKQFLAPGYRLGWVIVYHSEALLKGIVKLSQLILGPNSIIQSALPDIFENTPQSFFKDLNQTLKEHAMIVYNQLSTVTNVVKPQGAM